jgi:PEP-CTERM motif
MIKINRRHSLSLWSLLLATALPFVFLAAGAMSAHAGTVTVTGANGRPGLNGGTAGGSATATTNTPSDPSNTATATGGNGGSSCTGSADSGCFVGPGGAGGGAHSTATTSISTGAASAEAASFGGNGGNGEGHNIGPRGGIGGAASSNASASSTTGSAIATANSTGGRGGVGWGADGGTASSSAAASSTTGSASATASSTGGAGFGTAPSGAATASASAQNSDGAALTSASAPAGSSAEALTNAAVGSGSPTLVNITAGQAVCNATLTPANGSIVGVGAMSAAYGGTGQALTYEATATFDFSTSKREALDLNLLADNFSGIGFNSLELQVTPLDGTTQTYTFSSLTGSAGAEAFFARAIPLGTISGADTQPSVTLSYDLTFSAGTLAKAGDGFGFTYNITDPPLAGSAPEPSTWAMMIIGFASLAFAGYRRSRKRAASAA